MHPARPAPQTDLGLLPDPERNPAPVVSRLIVNGVILALLIVFGTVAHHEIQLRTMESTAIYFPKPLPPPVKVTVKAPPKVEPKLAKPQAPRIVQPRVKPKPEIKPLPAVKEAIALPAAQARPKVVLAPQPKLALAAAPALTPQVHPTVQLVHLDDRNGVKPNPDATRPTIVLALGNPYGGQGRVVAVGLPGSGSLPAGSSAISAPAEIRTPPPILLSHAQPECTTEALQLKMDGDVVLRVTLTAAGQMLVHRVIRGLGHGLDDAAMRSASSYKFKPATRNGQPVDYTTNIIIKFQTA